MTDNLYVLGILCLLVSTTEWLVQKTFLKHFGTALLVILITAVFANIGIIPAGSSAEAPVPIYDAIFTYVAPISIFWLLLRVNLQEIIKAGLPIVSLFLLGSIATAIGVILAMIIIRGDESIGVNYPAIGGMFTGTYTGGSVNFNAVALHYDVVKEGILYTGAVAVDNVITAFWMIATLAFPRILKRFWPQSTVTNSASGPLTGIEEDTEAIHPKDVGIVLALGVLALYISNLITGLTGIPSIINITILALIIAQLPWAKHIKGAQVIGMFAVYIFLAVIGAFCDLGALSQMGNLGFTLALMALIIVLVHGSITLIAARVMKIDLETASMISQANVGGGTSALAVARSFGRQDLVLPAVLIGSLGNGVGTFLGFLVADWLPVLL